MIIEPKDILVLPIVAIMILIAIMIMIAAIGGNAVWLGDVIRAIVYPLTVVSMLAAIGLAAYQSVSSSGR